MVGFMTFQYSVVARYFAVVINQNSLCTFSYGNESASSFKPTLYRPPIRMRPTLFQTEKYVL